ncbi:MAG: DUF1684 domain-containing protein [Caldilineaceae bacterium]
MSNPYITQIEAWRKQREADLRAPDSWLSLAGLFVLKEGQNTIGSAPTNAIVLPEHAPAELGVIEFSQAKATLVVSTQTPVLVDGAPAQRAPLTDNGHHQKPTLVTVGSITFFVHHFSDQYAIRVKDSANPAIQAFPGCVWFPVKPEYRVEGRFMRHAAPQSIPIKTTVNTDTAYESVGMVTFELLGQPLQLLAQDYGIPGQLAIVFRDATSGQQTYGAARFLTVELREDGAAVVDFNKAYNPPCAFTPYATCPLPPRENILRVPIEAGERYSAAH